MNLGQINKGLELTVKQKNQLKLETPIYLNKSLPKKESLGGDPSNPNKKEFEAEKDLMINLSKWFIETTPGFGIASGEASSAKSAPKAEEKKEEKKEIVKEAYDLELTTFDASKKIALIKEVRSITNLGLKEVC
jgi:hypothetical protein